MTALTARNIAWTADGASILDGVSLEARSGEMLGILGPNGAGKTSLLRILAGLRRPDAGDVALDGEDLGRMSRRRVARRVAIVEQSPHVHDDITVQETAALGRTPHHGMFATFDGKDHAAIERALALTEMERYRSRTWHDLSGGEQQRAQLARALAQEPDVIILDEPTNHLDIRYQLDVLTLLASLKMTVITALHDLNLAARFCDRVAVLHRGGLRAAGPPAEVLTAELLCSVYDVDAVVETSPHTGSQVATYLSRTHRAPLSRPLPGGHWSAIVERRRFRRR